MELEINDRYSIVLNDGNDGSPFEFYATRYGERWRELAGDNLVLALVQYIDCMREALEMQPCGGIITSDYCDPKCPMYNHCKNRSW